MTCVCKESSILSIALNAVHTWHTVCVKHSTKIVTKLVDKNAVWNYAGPFSIGMLLNHHWNMFLVQLSVLPHNCFWFTSWH